MNIPMATNFSKFFTASLLAPVLIGCASTGPGAGMQEYERVTVTPPSVVAARSEPMSPLGPPDPADPDPDSLKPTIIKGTDRMFNPPRVRPPVVVRGEAVSLRFEQAPVTDVVHAILGDILGLPYVVNQPVSGSLTIHTNDPLPRDQVLPVLDAVLQANGLAMVIDQSGVYHVGRPEVLRGISPSLGNLGGALPPGQNLLIVPLKYVGAPEMADILQPLASPETFVRIDAVRNLLILAGTRARLEGLMEIVNTFDVDVLKGMSIGLFPLKHVSVSDVDSALKAVMSGAGSAVGTQGAAKGARAEARGESGAPAASTLEMLGPIASVVRVIAIERLNALLVVTSRSYYLDQAREWIEKLDQPGGLDNEAQLFVYPVQNGTSSHLAELLNALFGDAEARPAATRDSGVAPGLAAGTVGDRTSVGQPDVAGVISGIALGPKVKVVADEFNTALLVYAPRSEYRKIEAALRRLDISPTQVLIEASILEVTLADELQYGLQWYFHGGIGGSRFDGEGRLSNVSSGAIAQNFPGFSYTVTNPAGEVRAVINALAQKSLINVISSPSIMVQDNHTATIQVGDQQPVRSSTTITDGGTTTSSIQFKDTGVSLSVTPSVNAGNLVSMIIDQSVTDVGPVDTATGQRSFLQRQIASRVSVRSGESVVLGGLIRDNTSRGRQGVPLLQDIPVLGSLFSTTTNSGTRTELLVMITPRVVRSEADLREVGAELRQRMRALDLLPERIGAAYSADQAPSVRGARGFGDVVPRLHEPSRPEAAWPTR